MFPLLNLSKYISAGWACPKALNDFQTINTSYSRPTFKKLLRKKIVFRVRDYVQFDRQNFLYDLDQEMIKVKAEAATRGVP